VESRSFTNGRRRVAWDTRSSAWGAHSGVERSFEEATTSGSKLEGHGTWWCEGKSKKKPPEVSRSNLKKSNLKNFKIPEEPWLRAGKRRENQHIFNVSFLSKSEKQKSRSCLAKTGTEQSSGVVNFKINKK
jgi:hypothetical protein